ncbi:MAG: FtsX-like permease family protein [Deltaproteobacteria bacterium]|nr:MAG: FtsX-like permease family protein [Deltaproteobacteria bacterium]
MLLARDIHLGLRHHLWTAVSAVLLIATATALAVSIRTFDTTTRQAVLDDLGALGADVRFVRADDPFANRQLTPGALERLAASPRVTGAIELRVLGGLTAVPTELTPPLAGELTVIAVDPAGDEVLAAAEGVPRLDPNLPFAVLGHRAAARLGVTALPASIVVLDTTAAEPAAMGRELVVTAKLEPTPLLTGIDDAVLVHRDLLAGSDGVDAAPEIVVRTDGSIGPSEIRRLADPLHPERSEVARPAVLEEALANSDSALTRLADTASAAAALAAMVTIIAMLTSSVRARRSEIGLRRCLGARSVDIFLLVGGEAAALAVTGALLGLGAASVAIAVWSEVHRLSPVIDTTHLVGVTGAAIGIAIIGATAPTVAAIRIDPAEAVRTDA